MPSCISAAMLLGALSVNPMAMQCNGHYVLGAAWTLHPPVWSKNPDLLVATPCPHLSSSWILLHTALCSSSWDPQLRNWTRNVRAMWIKRHLRKFPRFVQASKSSAATEVVIGCGGWRRGEGWAVFLEAHSILVLLTAKRTLERLKLCSLLASRFITH